MSVNSESYIFERSMEEKTEPESLISEKFYIDLNDNNSNNYNNQQLIFDLPSLALTDGFVSLSESVLRIPLQTTISSDTDLLNGFEHLLVGLKGTTACIIDSFQLTIDNRIVKTFSSHNEVPAYFKAITSMSSDYQKVAESLSNYSLDNGKPTYSNAQGEHQLGNNAVDVKNGRLSDLGDNVFQASANIINKSKSHFVKESAKKVTYNYLLEIPLKDTDEIFEKIPLSRGIYMKLSLQMHMGKTTFTSTAKAISALSSVTTYGVLPMYVNQSILTKTNGVLNAAGAGNVTIETAISKNSLSGAKNPLLAACQFHGCVYKPRLHQESVLNRRPPVKIDYNQPMFQTLRNVEPNTQFAFQISSSSSKSSYLLIHTRLSDTVNMNSDAVSNFASGTHNVPTSVMASPFSSSPMTTKAYSSLTQFQINIGGMPLFTRESLNIDYDFFNDNFRSFNALNGGKDKNESSGLINRETWEKLYGFIVIDLKRYELYANWVQPKDISVRAINNSPNKVDYMFFLMEEKDIKLDTSTGKLLI